MSANLNSVSFTHTKAIIWLQKTVLQCFVDVVVVFDSINNHPFVCLDILPNVKDNNRVLQEHKGEYDDRKSL